jgi:hypothetical protein
MESGKYNFDQMIGHIYQVCKDQHGCRYLQKKLEEQDPRVVDVIFTELFDHITELMTGTFHPPSLLPLTHAHAHTRLTLFFFFFSTYQILLETTSARSCSNTATTTKDF